MELRHLRYFVTVAEELNVSRASARLRISQPAVSRQVRDLEEELGVALFHRQKTGLKLTAAGENFLAHARDLLRRSAQAAQAMAAFRKPAAKGALRVGYITPVLASLLTPALRDFGQKSPEVEVVLREMAPGEQVKALREGRIDLALPGNPCPELGKEFEVVVLRRIPFEAVLPDNHPLAQRKRVGLAELKDETFIGFDEDHFPGRNEVICRACQQAGFTPRLRHRVEGLSALLAQVAAGNGVTLTPAEVGQLPHPGAVLVPLRPPVPSVASAAVFRKGEPRPTLVELMASPRRSA
ncbi:MAG TPA: LysR substrate-binding domain-containing protein [Candidatus Binatia bacterium]|jgi:DNA-binding transcriptional LysR family regulator|nr:LysR substrate-binding domain-containing protein [Candidatus Binatia bacterium]